MKSITAQILHQHKDKVIYKQTILSDTPTLTKEDDGNMFAEFDIPIFFDRPFIRRWVQSMRNKRITSRVLRFADQSGTILYSLPKKPLEAKLLISSDWDFYCHVKFAVTKEEVEELWKIFFG